MNSHECLKRNSTQISFHSLDVVTLRTELEIFIPQISHWNMSSQKTNLLGLLLQSDAQVTQVNEQKDKKTFFALVI